MQRYIAELTGSFFLTFALGLSGDPLAAGLIAAGVICVGGPISGAHYNPAVSLAFWAAGQLSKQNLAGYLFWQLSGALAGSLLIRFLGGTAFRLLPPAASGPVQYASVELLFSLLLCLIYLMLFLSPVYRRRVETGLVIGLAYAGILMTGQPVSGGVFNPSVALATSLIDYFDYGTSWLYLPTWVLAPAAGGIGAAWLFRYVSGLSGPEEPMDPKRARREA